MPAGKGQRHPARLCGPHHPHQEAGQYFRHRREGKQVKPCSVSVQTGRGTTRLFVWTPRCELIGLVEDVCGDLGYYCGLWLPRDSTSLIRSGSYTRRRWDDDLKNNEGSTSTNRTPSYQRRLASAGKYNGSANFSIWSDAFKGDIYSFWKRGKH